MAAPSKNLSQALPIIKSHYEDHAHDKEDHSLTDHVAKTRGGVITAFPLKLHQMLHQIEKDGFASVVSWLPHGRAFKIHKPEAFSRHIMPNYFRQTKITSFNRQLNLYGFNRLNFGPDKGAYYHELFLANREFLCHQMKRKKVKGTKVRRLLPPAAEPDFYAMPSVDAPQDDVAIEAIALNYHNIQSNNTFEPPKENTAERSDNFCYLKPSTANLHFQNVDSTGAYNRIKNHHPVKSYGGDNLVKSYDNVDFDSFFSTFLKPIDYSISEAALAFNSSSSLPEL